jgi:hypothetical protein
MRLNMDNICLFFNCQQMASTIYFSGNFCLAFSHEWTLSFNIVMGAPNKEVVPELDNVYYESGNNWHRSS